MVHWTEAAPPSDSYPLTLDGSYLFGNHTFGRKGSDIWEHGYQPLATFDANEDGHLTGEELSEVWIWIDANSNAQVDPGEFRPATDFVTSLTVTANVDDNGNAEAPTGAVLKDGTSVPTWDWWSRQWNLDLVRDRLISDDKGLRVRHRSMLLPTPSTGNASYLYYWSLPAAPEIGGFLRFFSVANDWYVISSSIQRPDYFSEELGYSVYEVPVTKVSPISGGLSWEFDLVFADWVDTAEVQITGNGDLLLGSSVKKTQNGPLHYRWVAERVGPTFDYGPFGPLAFSIAGFSELQLEKNMKSVPGSQLFLIPSNKGNFPDLASDFSQMILLKPTAPNFPSVLFSTR